MRGSSARLVAILAVTWLAVVSSVYVRDVGRGFVKDDFGWIESGRVALHTPTAPLLGKRIGFYRPVIDYTFALDYLVHGTNPRGYGFTNLALYVACVLAVWFFCRALGFSIEAATIAAVVWGANPHGINMALVWISGRTSLCLTLFSLLSAIALTQRRYVWMSVCLMLALASKEEAVALPIILFAWHVLVVDDRRTRAGAAVAGALPLALYFALRVHAGALTPATAPSYYQFVFAPARLARNAFEYADRGATAALVAVLIACAVYRHAPRITREQRGLLAACAIWFAGGYALTLFLPVRSSLYGLFPSVGAAIASAAIIESMRTSAADVRVGTLRLMTTMAAVLLALTPAYRSRNGRYVEPARFSERTLQALESEVAAARPGAVILLNDVTDPTSNFVGAFGTFASDAVRLHSSRALDVWIEPPPGEWRLAGLQAPRARQPVIAFATERGRIFRVNAATRE